MRVNPRGGQGVNKALLPALEATNMLLSAEKRDEIGLGEIEGFISQLEHLSMQTDTMTSHHAFQAD